MTNNTFKEISIIILITALISSLKILTKIHKTIYLTIKITNPTNTAPHLEFPPKTKLKIISYKKYNITTDETTSFIALSVKATKDLYTNVFTYQDQPITINSEVDFSYKNNHLKGKITSVSYNYPTENIQKYKLIFTNSNYSPPKQFIINSSLTRTKNLPIPLLNPETPAIIGYGPNLNIGEKLFLVRPLKKYYQYHLKSITPLSNPEKTNTNH